ncbi:MAG: type II toxin-antitoxin system VapC family toxin [Pirellulaceae bacterium]|nr:type II toxin-antitoxin system VapC family toxin [Pirellulaceae bacterium]
MPPALLDTDILSKFLKQKNPRVLQKAATYLALHGRFAISAMTRYEVLRGLKSKNATRQLNNFATFCRNVDVLPITDAILERASDLWVLALQTGHSRRDPDLIIAATALEHGRVLATGNNPHFAWIPGLTIEDWRQV